MAYPDPNADTDVDVARRWPGGAQVLAFDAQRPLRLRRIQAPTGLGQHRIGGGFQRILLGGQGATAQRRQTLPLVSGRAGGNARRPLRVRADLGLQALCARTTREQGQRQCGGGPAGAVLQEVLHVGSCAAASRRTGMMLGTSTWGRGSSSKAMSPSSTGMPVVWMVSKG